MACASGNSPRTTSLGECGSERLIRPALNSFTKQCRIALGTDLAEISAGVKRPRGEIMFYLLAMQAEGRLGLRDSVSQRYQLRSLLDDQLGLEPERSTRALYHELLGQR